MRSRPRAAMFAVSFANFKSRALSRDPSGDPVMPCAEVRVRAEASYGNITRFEPPQAAVFARGVA